MLVVGEVVLSFLKSNNLPGIIATQVKVKTMRLPRDRGRSENPVITRNKRYYLVERDPLGKRIAFHNTQYCKLVVNIKSSHMQISAKHYIPKNAN